MRFDPQAGFMPTEEGASPPSEAQATRPRRRAARWLLPGMVLSAASLCVWKFVLPAVAPSTLDALGRASADDGGGAGEAPGVDSRLAEALGEMSQGSDAARANIAHKLSGGAAFEAPVHVDEDALLAMVDASSAADASDAWREEAEEAQIALGRAEQLMGRGKYGEARRLLRQVRDHSPNDAQVCYKLGLACVMQGDFAGARAALEALRELDPSLASLLSNLVPKS